MITERFYKDPSDVLDFTIIWTLWLGSDAISTSTWSVPTGLTKNSDTHSATTATIYVSGGIAGTAYIVTNEIKTLAGLTKQKSLEIMVLEG